MTDGSNQGGTAGRSAITVGEASTRIWGMSSAERLSRIYGRIGLAETTHETLPALGEVVIVDAGWVFDEALIRALAGRPGVAMVDDSGRVVAAHLPVGQATGAAAGDLAGLPAEIPRLTALDIGSSYNSELRKREPPVLERLTPETVDAVEKRLFQGSYKGVTDLVTKYVWPAPARVITRWCALARITPNQVTFASFLMVLAAFALFWTGQYGWGLVCAWIMTFLDTVDGKLARVTLTSSKWGNVFDHGIDLIHPPFWWWAWLVGLGTLGLSPPHAGLLLAIVVGGYVAQRVEEGIFLGLFKVEMHAWRPFDSFFRLITARRNPNLLFLTASTLVGRPDVGFVLVAAWTAICFVVHASQIVQGLLTPKGGVTSWLAR